MSSLSISLLTLACVFGAALFGLFLNSVLPQNYLDEGSRDTVKLMTGLMATLSALVLGLLIASAKSSYDRTNQQFQQIAVEIVLIDHALAAYGPETKDVRTQLVATISALRFHSWSLHQRATVASPKDMLGRSKGRCASRGVSRTFDFK